MGGEAHHGKKRGTFIQRTIDALAEAMERSLYAEQIATLRGPLQQLDPRTKLSAALALIAVVESIRWRHVRKARRRLDTWGFKTEPLPPNAKDSDRAGDLD